MYVENEAGVRFEWNQAKKLMEKEICEQLDKKIMPCTEQEYFNAYAEAYEEKYEEEWSLAQVHPCG